MTEEPKLLVEWSSPWREFGSAIGPALARSPAPLAGEAPTGLFPLRGLLLSWGAEAILLVLAIILPAKMALLRPYHPPALPKHDVIYFHGTELPRVEDFGGAQVGRSGSAGGNQAHHASQTIRVVRGDTARDKVVDAPNLKLPVSNAPVENLLAFKPVPGPPPAEGLKSTLATPSLSQNSIVAPAPEVLRQMDRRIRILDQSVVAPPPGAVTDRQRQLMGLTPAIIAPAPTDVQREHARSIIAMTSPIIQPSPDDVHREPPPLRGPSGPPNTVVPPPVSAPVREGTQQAKLNLPAPSVIAPPPSHVTPDRSISGVSLADPKVVPPPVQLGGRSKDPRAVVGVTAAEPIVPPPPSVPGGTALDGGGRGQGKKAGGFGTLAADNIVPPPPGMLSNSEHAVAGGASGGSLGSTAVVPPPPGMSSAAGRSTSDPRAGLGSSPGSTTVVPPPPSLGGSAAAGGRGTGNRGTGLGGPLDAGSVLAPPSSAGGSGGGKGIIVSNQPGSGVGVPAGGSPGAIAMSPSGGDKPGLGGAGGGTGIGHGTGPGSGLSGTGPGAAKSGTGRGSDPNSHGGISPYPGPGGAGNGTTGQPPAPGAYVTGGSTATITLPSFGSGDPPSNSPGRSPTGGHGNFDYSIEASPRSGGGFNLYGMLKADKIFTIYIPTTAGRVVMTLGDPSSVNRVYAQDLTLPEPLLYKFPVKLNGARIIIRCQLNSAGALREFHKIEADPGAPTARVVAALATWKFTPATRGSSPVPVDVLLGFNIDTR